MALVDTRPIQGKAEKAAELLNVPGSFVWMYGGQGAGRDVALESLQAHFAHRLSIVRLAPLTSPDAVAHARLQLAVLAREDQTSLEYFAHSEASALSSHLNWLQRHDQILVLRMHRTWEQPEAVEHTLKDQASGFIRQLGNALKDASGLRVLVLAGTPRRESRDLGQPARHELNLDVPVLDAHALEETTSWNTLQDEFRSIRDGLAGLKPTPLQLRLGIALVALGDSAAEVSSLLKSLVSREYTQLEPLIKRLSRRLAGNALTPALRQAAFARFALPWKDYLKAVPELAGVEDLIRLGLGYETGEGRVRLSDPIRRALLSVSRPQEERLAPSDLQTHVRFEQAWTRLDGASSAESLDARHVIPWLEKMHHRAHGGGYSREQLEHLDLPAPELYWDLGRALSREQERFEDAATVYRRCWQKFEHDDYAHHYYAWNLDRIGQRSEDVENHYRRAIQERPKNTWWHARLCTFLIHRARFRDAEDCFREALLGLDPNEVEVSKDARFARSFHRWVVEAWLGMGEVQRAAGVFDLIPKDIVQGHEILKELSSRVKDAVEAVELGESVYPTFIPPEDRWRLPAFVPEEEAGQGLVQWWPGRIRKVDDTFVEFVHAEHSEDPASRELYGLEVPLAQWREWARKPNPQVDAFAILAEYQGGLKRVYHWPTHGTSRDDLLSDEELDLLRYVRRWVEASQNQDP